MPSLPKRPNAVYERLNVTSGRKMLDVVKCKVLSVIEGDEQDAYLLRLVYMLFPVDLFPNYNYSESSLIISPYRLILKTCGTTLNLLGVPRIIEIARVEAALP